MKTTIQNTLAAFAILTTAAFGQGGLTPVGAPAPTMKSLLELWNKVHGVELQATDIQTAVTGIQTAVDAIRDDARTPISSNLTVVGFSGSYYLTKNLTVASGDAIIIAVDDVTIDLNGFTISSTHASGSGSAILLSGTRQNIHIKNGSIKGTTNLSGDTFTGGGFNNGIFGASCVNVTVSDILIRNVAGTGISFGIPNPDANIIIEHCTVNTCAGDGLVAPIVRGSVALKTGGTAISATIVSDSIARSVGPNPFNNGIVGEQVSNSRGFSGAGHGILGDNITNSTGKSTTGKGIFAENVTNSIGESNTGDGIQALNVTNSRGNSMGAIGILAARNVTNSFGGSGTGAAGIDCTGTVSFSRGSSSGGPAIDAAIAIGCTASGGTVTAPQKHLGTP